MAEDKKELTDEQVKEAIKKKECPYCGGKTFTGHLEWADEPFSIFESGKIVYSAIESSAGYDAVVCVNCEEEIYPIIWKEWLIESVKGKVETLKKKRGENKCPRPEKK